MPLWWQSKPNRQGYARTVATSIPPWRVVPMDREYDILIAGAGPAGSMTALLLARLRPDLRVLLLDSQESPRAKPCGEYLSPGAVGVLHRAGLESAVLATGARPLEATTIVGPHGGPTVCHGPIFGLGPDRPFGLGIRRERFDRTLQEAAAQRVDLQRQTRILRFARSTGRWNVTVRHQGTERQLSCAMLIGADGRQSLVRHRAGLDRPVGRKRFALVCRARGIRHAEAVEMHLGPLGQIGLCPLGDGEVNLNLLLAGPSARLLPHRDPDTLFRTALAATPSLASRCHGATLSPILATGSLPQGSRSVIADGLCLVGDAAGFCDPFTGEGMTLALLGAEHCAQQVADIELTCMPSRDRLRGYADAYGRRIGRRHRLGEALQGLLGRRSVSERLAGWLGRSPLLSHLLVADAAGYRRIGS